MAYSALGYVDAVKELAAPGRHAGARDAPADAARKRRARSARPTSTRVMEKAMELLSRRAEEVAARHRLSQGPRPHRRDRRALSHRLRAGRLAGPEGGVSAVRRQGAGRVRPGDRRRRGQALRPLPRPRHVPDLQRARHGDRLRRPRDRRGRAQVPELARDAAVREGPRALRPVQARDAIRNAGRVLVVEGYMDVVALAQFEVGYAVATLGTATTPVHVQKLLRLADEIVFCFDGDAAGRKAAWRALEVSLPLAPDHKPIRFLFLPEGDDPDTYVRKHGKEAWKRSVREAETLSPVPARAAARRVRPRDGGGPRRLVVDRQAARAEDHRAGAAAAAHQRDRAARRASREGGIERLLGCRRSRACRARRRRGRAYTAPDSHRNGACSTALLLQPVACRAHRRGCLDPGRPESQALLAVRDACRECDDEPSPGLLLDRLQGNPCIGDRCCAPIDMGKRSALPPRKRRPSSPRRWSSWIWPAARQELDELRGARGSSVAQEEPLQRLQRRRMLAYKKLQGHFQAFERSM